MHCSSQIDKMAESAEDQLEATLHPCEEAPKGSLDDGEAREESFEDLDELHRSILSLCDGCITVDETQCSPVGDATVTVVKESTSDKDYSDEGAGKIHPRMQDPGLSPIKLRLPAAEVPKELGGVPRPVSDSNVLSLDDVDQTYEELITEITALCESRNSESEGTDNYEEDDDQLLEESKYLNTIGLGSILSSTPNPDLMKREGEYKFTFDMDGRTDGDSLLPQTGFGDNCSINKQSSSATPQKTQTLSKPSALTTIYNTPNIAVMKASALGQPGRFKHVNISRQTDVDSSLQEDLDDAGIDILGLDEFTTMVESDSEDEDEDEGKRNIEQWQTVLHKSPEHDDTLKDGQDGVAEPSAKHGKKRSSSVFQLDLQEHTVEVKDFLLSEPVQEDKKTQGQTLEMKKCKIDISEPLEIRPTEDQTVDVRKIVRSQIAEMVKEVTEQTMTQPCATSNEADTHNSEDLTSSEYEVSETVKRSKIVRDQIAEMIREVSEGNQTVWQQKSAINEVNIPISDAPVTAESDEVDKRSEIVRGQIAKIVREVNQTNETLQQSTTVINKVEIPRHDKLFSNNSENIHTLEKRPKIIFGQIAKIVDPVDQGEQTVSRPKPVSEKMNVPKSETLYSEKGLGVQNAEKQPQHVRGQISEMIRKVNENREIPPKIIREEAIRNMETELRNDSWIIIDLADLDNKDEPATKKPKQDTVPITTDPAKSDTSNKTTEEKQTEIARDQIAESLKAVGAEKEDPSRDLNVTVDTDLSESDMISFSEKATKAVGNNSIADLSEMILLSELSEEAELLGKSTNDVSDLSERDMISILETPEAFKSELQKVTEVLKAKETSGPADVVSIVESKTVPRKFGSEGSGVAVDSIKIRSETPVPPKTASKLIDPKPEEKPCVIMTKASGAQENMRSNVPKDTKSLEAPFVDSKSVLGEQKKIQKKNGGEVVGKAIPQTSEVSNLTLKKPEAKVQPNAHTLKKPEAKVHPMPSVRNKATLKKGTSVKRTPEAEQGHFGISTQPVSGVDTQESTLKVVPESIFLEEDNEIIKQVKGRWECDGIPTPDTNLTCANYWRKHQLKGQQRVTPTRTSYLEGNFRASPMVDRINKTKEKTASENNRGTKRKRERDDVIVDSSDNYRWDGKRARYDHDTRTGLQENASSSLKKQLNKLQQDFRQRVQNLMAEQDKLKRDMAHEHMEQTDNLRRRQTREMQTLYVNCFDSRLLQRPFYLLRNQHQNQLQRLQCEQFKSIESMETHTKRKIADERKKFVNIEEQLLQLLEKDEGKVGAGAKMIYKTVSLTKGPCRSNGQKKSWVKVCLPADIASAIIREDLIYDAFYDY